MDRPSCPPTGIAWRTSQASEEFDNRTGINKLQVLLRTGLARRNNFARNRFPTAQLRGSVSNADQQPKGPANTVTIL